MSTTDPFDALGEMRRWADLIRCHEIARAESARTYLVRDPGYAVEVAAFAAAHGLDDVVTVQSSPVVPAGQVYVIDHQPAGQVYVIDHQAIEANLRAALQAWLPYRPDSSLG